MTKQILMIEKWLSIAQQNPWIRQRGSSDANDTCAFEPPLSEQDFFQCNTVVELYNYLVRGNWMLGQPFYFKNLCFINQINAGDEWLVIRNGIAFESLTAGAMGYEQFRDWIKCVMNATDEDLKNLEYTSEEYEIKHRIRRR